MSTSLLARYQNLAQSSDYRTRRLAERQLARLQHTSARAAAAGTRSRWGHVPVADLFIAAGNPVYGRASGRLETGHEPLHASKSGRCVLITPERGLWWCRSCRRGGDAASLLMQVHGWSYDQAAKHLAFRFGTARRPVLRVGGPA